MITESDLKAAIAECQGERNPNANTCIKMAAYYTILKEMQTNASAYSHDTVPTINADAIEALVQYNSDTDFANAIQDKSAASVWAVVDELMSVVQALHPRLYDATLRKLHDI